MKKKLYMLIICSLLLVGCGADLSEPMGEYNEKYFIRVAYDDGIEIAYAKDTKVMYAISRTAYNSGSVTLLVDVDGKPLIYSDNKHLADVPDTNVGEIDE